jgi:hypothetical protein
VIAKIQDLSIEQFRDVSEKAGALIVVLPSDLTALNIEDREVKIISTKSINEIFMRLNNFAEHVGARRLDDGAGSANSGVFHTLESID